MRLNRPTLTLTVSLLLALAISALPLRQSAAQPFPSVTGPTYTVVAIDGAGVNVNGSPLQVGHSYDADDVVSVTSGGQSGTLVILRTDGFSMGIDGFGAAGCDGLSFQAIWTGDE